MIVSAPAGSPPWPTCAFPQNTGTSSAVLLAPTHAYSTRYVEGSATKRNMTQRLSHLM